jgi:curved DNA-binding protein CbpA
MTLAELQALGFYDVLGVQPGATSAELRKGFKAMSLVYHPDKGGSAVLFRFIKMVYDTLSDPITRTKYDDDGKTSFMEAEPQAQTDTMSMPMPPINTAFMRQLAGLQGAATHRWKTGNLADALNDTANLAVGREYECYKECGLATALGLKLRLVGTLPDIPVYSTPRVVRFAAFTAMDLQELDAPASHGRQILKYARRHELFRPVLEQAFADGARIQQFRSSFNGIKPAEIKRIVNLLGYGNGGREWMKHHGMAVLPVRLGQLKGEIKTVVKHMVTNIDPHWLQHIKHRKRWHLTLLSIHCQLGERLDLDVVRELLPPCTVSHGWLGDSILIAPSIDFDADAFILMLSSRDIVMTIKPLPQTTHEYFEMYKSVTGVDFDRSPPSGRAVRQAEAKAYAQRYLDKPSAMSYVPHLEFAIAVEALLPMVYNPDTKQIEFFSAPHGRWFEGGGQEQAKGEVLSDALMATFAPTQWGFEETDGRFKLRRVKAMWDDSCFRSNSFLGPIGEAVKNLRFRRDTGLDTDPRASKVINFEGPYHLDFATPVPAFDWSSDEQLETAIYMPLQDCYK